MLAPVCCSIWTECCWLGRLPLCGVLLLLQLYSLQSLPQLLLHSLHVFVSLLVGRSVSPPVADLYQLLPPSEMADCLLQSMAPSEMAAYLIHSPAPSELAAYWKQLLVLLEPDALRVGTIGGALLWPRRGGSRLYRWIQLAGRVTVRPVLVHRLPLAALTSSNL